MRMHRPVRRAAKVTAITFWYGGIKPDNLTQPRILYRLAFLVFAFVMTLIMRAKGA
jgi:hypothetical protein